MAKSLCVRFCDALPDERLLALAQLWFNDLPESWRYQSDCSVVVRRDKSEGMRAIHHVQVDLDHGVAHSRVFATSSDADPYTALSRAFDKARSSMEHVANPWLQ